MRFAENPKYRLLQVFLGPSVDKVQVYEVYIDTTTNDMRCTCPGWQLRHTCKHSAFVEQQVEIHGGYIASVMRSDAQFDPEILQDPVAFRQWVYDNAKVLMLE